MVKLDCCYMMCAWREPAARKEMPRSRPVIPRNYHELLYFVMSAPLLLGPCFNAQLRPLINRTLSRVLFPTGEITANHPTTGFACLKKHLGSAGTSLRD